MSESPETREQAFTVTDLLRKTEAIRSSSALADVATKIFDYAQFLLDNDENLTRTGALNGEARELLRKRVLELVGDDTVESVDLTLEASTPERGQE